MSREKSAFLVVLGATILTMVLMMGAAAKESIAYSFWGQPEQVDLMLKVLSRFEEKHPNISVEPRYSVFGTYHEKLLVEMTSGLAADVILVSPAYFPQFVDHNVFMDLTDLAKRDLKMNDYFPTAPVYYEGRLYGLPHILDVEMMYFNQDLFEAAGVDLPHESWTWDEDFLPAVRKLTRKNGEGAVTQFGAFRNAGSIYTLWSAMTARGGGFYDVAQKKVLVNQPESIETLRFFHSLAHVYGAAAAPGIPTAGGGNWTNGTVATNIGWNSGIGYNHARNLPFEWHASVMPGWSGGKRVTESHATAFMINASTKKVETAWTLAKYLGYEPEATLVAEGAWGPAKRQSTWRSFLPQIERVVPGHQQDWEAVFRSFEFGQKFPWTAEYTQVQQAHSRHLAVLWANTSGPETVAEQFADSLQAILSYSR
ncbi:MAG: ABC transporter substrate-binding protein [Limnochordia bacterium]